MDLRPLQDIYTSNGPFLTVHAEIGRGTEDAAKQIDVRWNAIRQQLEDHGVGADLMGLVESRVRENRHVPGEARLSLVAAEGRVVFEDVRVGHSIAPETTDVGPLPDLSGWLRQADAQVPFVLVVADRKGADIDTYRALTVADHEHTEVAGESYYITKVAQGDWAHPQYQRTAENRWQHNANEVADEVKSLVRAHRPEVIVLAGDERARGDIADALEGVPTDVVHVTAGGRAAGSSEEALWAEVRRVVAHVQAEREAAVAERLLEASGQGRGAARGLADVLDALVQGKAEHLVLDVDAARELEVAPAEHPGIGLPPSALEEKSLPADRVLVAMGAATGTDLSLLPTQATKGAGVAALLRWDQ